MPPTLLVQGSLVANDPKDQKSLDNQIPIEYILEWFRGKINSRSVGLANRVLVLKSDTGSGKSTAFPAALFSAFFKKGAGGIACAQPRVLNAVTIVRDLVSSGFYPFFKLGENIGYQTGPAKKAAKFGLTYMTIGVLSMQLKTMTDDLLMHKYRFIIVDEVHEASLEQAMLLFSLRNFMQRNANNPNLPYVILTSATFDTKKFLRYFGVLTDDIKQPNLIQVAGFTYPLEEVWLLENSTTNYIKTAVDFVEKIHLENLNDKPENADILIFLPGMGEITKIRQGLEKLNIKLFNKKKPIFMPLTVVSETVSGNKPEYIAVFTSPDNLEVEISKKKMKPLRRVILSTNVAETGVTIDTLKYVIDSGFNRTPEFNPNFSTNTLITKAATKSMIRQRMGRANRKSVGVFYPMYPKYVFEKLDDIQLGNIETDDMSGILLGLLYEQVKRDNSDNYEGPLDISRIDMLDMPPVDSFAHGLEKLYSIGFISPYSDHKYIKLDSSNYLDRLELLRDNSSETKKYNITKMGALAIGFSKITPENIRMILAGYAHDCGILDLITIAAWLTMDSRDILVSATVSPDWLEIYREGLPSYYTGGAANLAKADLIYRVKLLLSDDFLSGLVLFSAVGNVIKRLKHSEYFSGLSKWCEMHRVKFQSIIKFIQLRDEIIDNMLSNGLETFVGDSLVDLPEELFIDGVTKLKYCIYEGYRCNMAIYDITKNKYHTIQDIPLKTPEIFEQNELKIAEQKKYDITEFTKPKYILYDSIVMKLNPKTQLYVAKAQRVSMMDGFVKIDLDFI